MPRRLPTLMPLSVAATVGLFILTSVLMAQPPAPPSPVSGEGIKRTQEENLKLYKRFADELLKLAQRWEKSDNADEKERAKTLRAALKIADEKGVENLFKGVVKALDGNKTPTPGDFGGIIAKDAELLKALELILETLETEDEVDKLRKDIKDLVELKKEIERVKREQENIRGRTDLPKADPDKIAKDQKDLADKTKDIANTSKNDPKDPKNGNGDPSGKDDKSDPKGEPKPGDNTGEQKPDTKDPKNSDAKDPMAGMGDPKDSKGGGEPKPSPMGNMKPDAGSSKETPKDSMPDPMGGKGMGDPKPMDPKDGAGKPMQGDGKAQGDGKGDSKPSDGMGGEGKPMPGGGMPSDSPPSGSKGSPPPGGGSPPPGGGMPPPPSPADQIRGKLDEVVPDQKGAADDLKKNDRPNAGKKEDDAIKKIDEVLKELEKRLKQLREKEMLKKLEDLERRVKKMLDLQIQVYEATKAIDGTIRKNNNQKSSLEIQKSGVESEKEGIISDEATKALKLLEGEGTAIVFAGVLSELRKDMDAVQKQLLAANVGEDTQLVERQIIEQLQRMLEALKKAKEDLQNPPMPPMPGDPPPPDDKKDDLIKLVEQLKLLRALQGQLNERTTAFGKRTPGVQANDPFIQEQLKQLGERQKFLQDLIRKISTELDPKIKQ